MTERAAKKPRAAAKPRINRFPGKCMDCGAKVRSGTGVAVQQPQNKVWDLFCRQHAGENVGLLVTAPRRVELLARQQQMADDTGSPNFCSRNGNCPHCKADMIGFLGERCATEGITGCPVCYISFCE